MQAVILAAGRGKRMGDLTNTTPKPLLEVGGKSLLQHKIEALPSLINEVILVVGYQKEQITETIGDVCCGKKITYVVMDELTGTAPALWLCKDILQGHTLVLMGDDVYGKEDMERAVRYPWMIGIQPSNEAFAGGKIVSKANALRSVLEIGGEAGDFVNTGMYVIGPEIFSYEMVQLPNGEYGLPQTLAVAAQHIEVVTMSVDTWIRITAPEDLQKAAQELL